MDTNWFYEGYMAEQAGDLNKALECYEQAIMHNQETALSYFRKGKALYDLGNYESANKTLDVALTLEPKMSVACYWKVLSLQRLNRYDEALFCIDKMLLLELDLDARADLLVQKGMILQKLGRLTEAYSCINFALSIQPNDDIKVRIYHQLGILWTLIKNYDEALKVFDASLSIKEDSFIWLYKGIINADMGLLSMAKECFERALKEEPGLLIARILRAKVLQEEKNIEEYRSEIKALTEESPKDIRLLKLLLSNLLGGVELSSILYHYTSVSALESILKNGELWVTRIDFLNDPSERTYILNLLSDLPKVIENDTELTPEQKKLFTDIGNVVLEILSRLLGKPTITIYDSKLLTSDEYSEIFAWGSQLCANGVYVLSLSEDNDSLTLWGNYSKPDGYNIGFNMQEINQYFQNMENAYNPEDRVFDISFLGKVQYDTDLIYAEFKQLCLEWSNVLSRKALVTILLNSTIITSMFTKAPTFRPENEARVVFLILDDKDNNDKVQFRNYNSSFIPYIRVPLRVSNTPNLPIDAITIGPKNKIDIARTGLECFLQKYNIKLKGGIEESRIPLRY